MEHMIEVTYSPTKKDEGPFRLKVYEGDNTGRKKIVQGVSIPGGKQQFWIADCASNRQFLATTNNQAFHYVLPEDKGKSNEPSSKEKQQAAEIEALKAEIARNDALTNVPDRPEELTDTTKVKRVDLLAELKLKGIKYNPRAKNVELMELLNASTADIQPS
jgi:hypothetical protein